MSATHILNPQTAEQIGTDAEWAFIDNAKIVDGSYAGIASGVIVNETTTRLLTLTNFGFTIPENETLIALTAKITRMKFGTGTNMTCHDVVFQLINEGSLIGENKAVTTAWSTNTFREDEYDMFDHDLLTDEVITSPTFGVAMSILIYDHSVPAFGVAPRIDGLTLTFETVYDLKRKTTTFMGNLNPGSQMFVGTPFNGHVR